MRPSAPCKITGSSSKLNVQCHEMKVDHTSDHQRSQSWLLDGFRSYRYQIACHSSCWLPFKSKLPPLTLQWKAQYSAVYIPRVLDLNVISNPRLDFVVLIAKPNLTSHRFSQFQQYQNIPCSSDSAPLIFIKFPNLHKQNIDITELDSCSSSSLPEVSISYKTPLKQNLMA